MAIQTTAEARSAFLDEFRRLEGQLVGHDRPWLADLRRTAIDRFAEMGFPGPKDEAWKYTSAGSMVRERLQQAPGDFSMDARELDALRAAIAALPGIASADPLAVFLNGRFIETVSRVGALKGASVESLAQRLRTDGEVISGHLAKILDPGVHGFAALNTALFTDGPVVRIARGKTVERPIHVVFYSTSRDTPLAVQPRSLLIVEEGAGARVVEHWVGQADAKYLANGVTEIMLGPTSSLEHLKVQHESDRAFHVHRIQVHQHAGSSLRSYAIALGGAVSRTEITTVLAGEGAECALYGLYVVNGQRHVDHHTTIDHSAPRTTSREVYKGILDQKARGVFTGKVYVRAAAQQTSAEQTNRNLLLAEGAVVETRPQLEIYADDVKCTHGAAVGRLDEDALFYMRQRGIDPAAARTLLTYAFASEVLERIGIAELRRDLERRVVERIGRADGLAMEEALA